MNDLKQQVAQDLADSGLFDKFTHRHLLEGGYYAHHGDHQDVIGPYLEADDVEAILGEMKLQVALVTTEDHQQEYCIVKYIWFTGVGKYGDLVGDHLVFITLDVKPGQRTLANNAALAWATKQPDWKPKLKAALERLGWV